MFILSVSKYRWRISEGHKTVLSGIGSATEAALIAKRLGYILTEFKDLNHLKVA